jgi:predicted esterase
MTVPAAAPVPTRHEDLVTRRRARCAVRGPADPRAARELWILLHGYGQLAAPFLDGCRALDDGTRLLVAPEALSRFYDAASATDRHAEAAVGASWMTREDRLREIEDQLDWLTLAHDTFAARLPPGTPVTVLGFSQGATAASRWVASGRVRPDRLVLWGASVAPELALGPEGALRGPRTTIVIGERDRFVPAERVRAEEARLEAAGFPHRLVSFSGGHRLDDATLRAIAEGA